MKRVIAVMVIGALVCSACGVDRGRYRFIPITAGVLETPATITAEDGSFRIAAGERFPSPFQQGDNCLLEPTAENYPQGLATGARPVVVDLANGQRLYGLLSLCGAPPSSTGAAAARQYQIQIPESYVAATAGGRVSVVFETFTTGTLGAKAWILWLSETSFAHQPPVAGGATAHSTVGEQLDVASGMKKVSMWSGGIGAVLALVGVAVVADKPEGGTMIVGAVSLGLGALGLIGWITMYASGNKAENGVRERLGSLDDYRRDTRIAQPASSGASVGWSWSF